MDDVYDLSVEYPPLLPPPRQGLDTEKVGALLVAASGAAVDVRTALEDPNIDPKLKALINLNLAILETLEAVFECGLKPLSGPASGRGTGSGRSGAVGAVAPPVPDRPKTVPGLNELKESLCKADKESIMFEANLGPNTQANRNNLAAAFSASIRTAAIDKAKAAGECPAEAVRVMDDVLSCVTDMEFIGSASQKFLSKNLTDTRNNTFCTMPVKFKFDSRDTRIHFETSMRNFCNLRVGISLPKPVRLEQAAFLASLRERYPGDAVTVRPDIRSRTLFALRKIGGEGPWERCAETLLLSPEIMLPTFIPRKRVPLPTETAVAAAAGSLQIEMQGVEGAGGESGSQQS
jgi:hypothetical protein